MAFSLLVRELCWHSFIFFAVTVLGYFAAAGGLYWLLYMRRSSRFALPASQISPPEIWLAARNDVVLSVASSGIFAICAALMMAAYEAGYTRLYLQPERYGLWYLGGSLVLVLLLQDTYFYFTHRLAHHPKCYRWMHRGHHHLKRPTPWTAFSFDPAEALVQAVFLMAVTAVMPIHLSVLLAVVIVMTMGALFHHFGVRLFEESTWGRWLGSWLVGTTHHGLHHRKYTVHYGLYFTFWDRLLGTQQARYTDVFSPSVVVGKEADDEKTTNGKTTRETTTEQLPVMSAGRCEEQATHAG